MIFDTIDINAPHQAAPPAQTSQAPAGQAVPTNSQPSATTGAAPGITKMSTGVFPSFDQMANNVAAATGAGGPPQAAPPAQTFTPSPNMLNAQQRDFAQLAASTNLRDRLPQGWEASMPQWWKPGMGFHNPAAPGAAAPVAASGTPLAGATPAAVASAAPTPAPPPSGTHPIQPGGIINEDMLRGTVPEVNPYGQTSHYTNSVRGHLDALLDDESSYLQRARTKAAQVANSRGLLNSSMAAEAGESAAIGAALPIAQQDAGQRQSLQQAGFQMSGNIQGQYGQHVSTIQASASNAIAQIAAAENIPSDVKQSLIQGMQAQRDADLSYIGAVYDSMSVWDPTWTLIGGTVANTGATGGAGAVSPGFPTIPSVATPGAGTGAGTDDGIGTGGAVGVGGVVGAVGDLAQQALGGGSDAGGGGTPTTPPGAGGVIDSAIGGGSGVGGLDTTTLPSVVSAGDLALGDSIAGTGDLFTGVAPSGLDAGTGGSVTLNPSDVVISNSADSAGGFSITDLPTGTLDSLIAGGFDAVSLAGGLTGGVQGLGALTPTLQAAAGGPLGGAWGSGVASQLAAQTGATAGATTAAGAGTAAGFAGAALGAAFVLPVALGILSKLMGAKPNAAANEAFDQLHGVLSNQTAVTIPAGQPGAGGQGLPVQIGGELVYLDADLSTHIPGEAFRIAGGTRVVKPNIDTGVLEIREYSETNAAEGERKNARALGIDTRAQSMQQVQAAMQAQEAFETDPALSTVQRNAIRENPTLRAAYVATGGNMTGKVPGQGNIMLFELLSAATNQG